jgi:hypothetical protein
MIPQNQEDFTAGRIHPASYDTILPPDARSELLQPKRPAILHRPLYQPPERSGILKWAGGFLLCAIILAGVIGHYSQSLKTPLAPQHSVPVVQPTPVLEKPASQPMAKPQPISEPPVGPPPPAVIAPRARLVLFKRWLGNSVWELTDSTGRAVKILVDPAPRAHLVRAPEWQPGQARIMRMPYDMEVQGVLKGSLSDEAFLPRSGNAIGDTWIVGRTPWIWITTPGTAVPQWVDP